MMKPKVLWGIVIFLLAACEKTDIPHSTAASEAAVHLQTNWATGHGLSAQALKPYAESVARDLIATVGQRQTYAMLGWQANPAYEPMERCFDLWYGSDKQNGVDQSARDFPTADDCEQHVRDLSRLYASYGVAAKPVLFKSRYYWAQKKQFDAAWPGLVEAWEAAGGSKDDASYLQHPGCVETLQTGWTGSDYFYSGEEHPLCRFYKIEAMEMRD